MATVDELVVKLRADTAQFEQGMGKAGKSTNDFSVVARRAQQAVAGLIATMGAREVIQYADAYKSLTGRLTIVTKDAEELADVQQRLFDIAQETRQPLQASVAGYSRLSLSLNDNQKASVDLIKFTELLSKTIAISGTNAQGAQTFFEQFGQGASSDFKAIGQELATFADQNPAFYKIINDAAKESGQTIRQMAESGGLSFDFIAKAVNKASANIESDFQKIPKTVTQALTTVDNAFLQYIGQSSAVAAGTGSVTSALTALAQNFDVVANAILAVGGVALVRYAAGLIPSIAGTLALNAAMLAAVGPARAMGIAMAALGGPIGIALSAALVAAALHTNQASVAQERYNAMLNDSRKSFKNFSNASTDAKVNIINDTNQRIQALINEAKALDGLIEGYTTMSNSNLAGRTLGALGVGVREGAGKLGIGKAPSEVLAQRDALAKTIKEMEALVKNPIKAGAEPAAGVSPQTLSTQKESIKNKKEMLQQDAHILEYNKELLEVEKERERQIDALGVSASNAFKDAIFGAQSFGDALGAIGNQIENLLFDRVVTQPLNELFKGATGGGDLLGGLFSGIGDIFRAEGGAVQAGMPYVVGEKRPEIFVPSSGGRIVPNVGGMGGGANVSVNIINNSSAKVSTQSSQNSNGGTDLRLMIDDAVANNMATRGSKTNQALAAFNSQSLVRR